MPETKTTRDALLDAAYDVILAGDWQRARMVDVAAAAGVSRQTLYNEFGNKDSLAQALAEREAQRFIEGTNRFIDEVHPDRPFDAIAAATVGDGSKIQLQPMDLKTAFAGLPAGAVDVLTHRFTWTQSRDIGGLKFPKTMFYDGQGFAVLAKTHANKISDLNGASICMAQGSTSELIVADYFRAHKLKYKPVTFASQELAWDAFTSKRCDAAMNDRSGLASRLAKLPNAKDFKVLAETVSNEPIGPIVAQGQPRWEAVVRFTLNALVAAEELGVTQANADEMLKSQNPDIQRLLGVNGDLGSKKGVANDYAYKAIKAVGNYGEIWDRNVGPNTPLRLERGRNALVSHGGVMMSVPVR